MTAARRGLCLLVAAASVAAALQAAPPPPAFAASHDDAHRGHYRVGGTARWTKWTHYNGWACDGDLTTTTGTYKLGDVVHTYTATYRAGCTAARLEEGGDTLPATSYPYDADAPENSTVVTCLVGSASTTSGCDHSADASSGWRWTGHPRDNTHVPGSRQCTIVDNAPFPIGDDDACELWVACTDGVLTGGNPPTHQNRPSAPLNCDSMHPCWNTVEEFSQTRPRHTVLAANSAPPERRTSMAYRNLSDLI